MSDRSRALPGTIAAVGSPNLAFDFQLHQTLGGKADNLA